MTLNQALFKQNGGVGYVLKPAFMRSTYEDAEDDGDFELTKVSRGLMPIYCHNKEELLENEIGTYLVVKYEIIMYHAAHASRFHQVCQSIACSLHGDLLSDYSFVVTIGFNSFAFVFVGG